MAVQLGLSEGQTAAAISVEDTRAENRRDLGRRVCALIAVMSLIITACGDDDDSEAAPIPEPLEYAESVTAKYKDVWRALADDYFFGPVCAPGDLSPLEGAAGIHLGNVGLIRDPFLDEGQPEVLMYMPTDTGYELVGVEYIVPDAGQEPPELFGQEFEGFNAANTPGLLQSLPPGNPNAFYLHAWLHRENPRGVFADGNPDLRCPANPAFGGGSYLFGTGSGLLGEDAGPAEGDRLFVVVGVGELPSGKVEGRVDVFHISRAGALRSELHADIDCLDLDSTTAKVSGTLVSGVNAFVPPDFEIAGERFALNVTELGGGDLKFSTDTTFFGGPHPLGDCATIEGNELELDRGLFIFDAEGPPAL